MKITTRLGGVALAVALGSTIVTGCTNSCSTSQPRASKHAPEKDDAEKQIDAHIDRKVRIAERAHDFTLGRRDAPLSLVVALDYECPHSARFAGELPTLMQRWSDQLRLVIKQCPLATHRKAERAAEAALAAHAQDRYWAFQTAAFARRGKLDDAELLAIAKETGLDIDRFRKELDAGTHRAALERDILDCDEAGVTGSPALFINGTPIGGAPLQSDLDKMLGAELELLKALALETDADPGQMRRELETMVAPRKYGRVRPEPSGHGKPATTGSATAGAADADVEIVVYGNYDCDGSARLTIALSELLRRYSGKLRVVWKDYDPFLSDKARGLRQAALAAHAQGKFWELHTRMIARRGDLAADDVPALARQAGLDMTRFDRDRRSGETAQVIAAEDAELAALSLEGTPIVFVNGARFDGAPSYVVIDELVGRDVARARRTRAAAARPQR